MTMTETETQTETRYVLDFHWYWALFEGEAISDRFGVCAARDFLRPLAHFLGPGHFVLDAIAIDADELGVTYRVDGVAHAIRFDGVAPRAFVDYLLARINETLARTDHMFALVVPRRYELRGVLVPRTSTARPQPLTIES